MRFMMGARFPISGDIEIGSRAIPVVHGIGEATKCGGVFELVVDCSAIQRGFAERTTTISCRTVASFSGLCLISPTLAKTKLDSCPKPAINGRVKRNELCILKQRDTETETAA